MKVLHLICLPGSDLLYGLTLQVSPDVSQPLISDLLSPSLLSPSCGMGWKCGRAYLGAGNERKGVVGEI